MTFTSFHFLLFFSGLLCLYYLIPKAWQTGLLSLASLVFCFSAGGKRMLASLLFASLTTWYAAARMEASGTKRGKTFWFYGALLLNHRWVHSPPLGA